MKIGRNQKKMLSKKIGLTKSIIESNFFLIKLIHRTCPWFLPISLGVMSIEAISIFISNSYLLRYALNGINKGLTFVEIADLIMIWIVASLFIYILGALYHQWFHKVSIVKVKNAIFRIVYEKAIEVELERYEDPKYYNEMSKTIGECERRIEEIINAITILWTKSILLASNIVLMAVIDYRILCFLLVPLLGIVLQTKVNKKEYDKNMEMVEGNRRKEYVQRTFYLAEYAKEMRLLHMSNLLIKNCEEMGKKIISIIKKYGFSIAILRYIVVIFNEMITTLGATLYVTWKAFGDKTIGYGDCIVIINSIENVAFILTDLAGVLSKFHENALYIQNLRSFLNYEPTLVGGTTLLPDKGDIVLKNVSFKYEGSDKQILKNISMQFGEKQKVAIVGKNGAGKTTLLKILLRLYDTKNEITYGGISIKKFFLKEYRDMFSFVLQDMQVFAMSIADNVRKGRNEEEDTKIIENSLKKSGLFEKVKLLPDGINHLLTKEFDNNGIQLSGGEKQKLALAHIYAKNSRFVILDEPSSMLDPKAEYEMYKKLLEVSNDRGVIFVSHRLSLVAMADYIYYLENGEVAEEGKHQELLKLNGKYAEMYKKQAQNYIEVS